MRSIWKNGLELSPLQIRQVSPFAEPSFLSKFNTISIGNQTQRQRETGEDPRFATEEEEGDEVTRGFVERD